MIQTLEVEVSDSSFYSSFEELSEEEESKESESEKESNEESRNSFSNSDVLDWKGFFVHYTDKNSLDKSY